MLFKLPTGDWIAPSCILGIRLATNDKLGPRAFIDTTFDHSHHVIEFDDPETARRWVEEFGQLCSAAVMAHA